jgi:hypothetical protein
MPTLRGLSAGHEDGTDALLFPDCGICGALAPFGTQANRTA